MAGGTRRRTGKDEGAADDVEAALRTRLAAGDVKGAATGAIRAYGPELLRYLRGLLAREADAKEAFSSACERLWRSLPEFRGEASLRTWCFHLAWSAAADLKKEAWTARGQRLETDEAAALAEDDRTRSWLREERLRLSLDELRRGLTLEEQGLLRLRVDQGLSWAECAAVLTADGRAPKVEALMKRFERIKARLGTLARGEAAE
jgi:RNA polymerase sigma-70 factor (ECF subfamily)